MDNTKKESVLRVVKITGILMIITTLIAVLLAVINMLTEPVIAKNTADEKQAAILELFPEAARTYSIKDMGNIGENFPKSITDLYAVAGADNKVIGFVADVSSMGFSDYIGMMVGVNIDNTVRGIRIMSISDTPGLGMKVNDPNYLDGYQGISYPVTFEAGSHHADAISGATYSSRGVLNGVNDALAFCSLIVIDESANGEEGTVNE